MERRSAYEGHLVWVTTLCSPTCRSLPLRYKDVLKGGLRALNANTENWEQLTLERALWHSLLQDRRTYSIETYVTDCNRRRIYRRTRQERSKRECKRTNAN